MKNPLTQSIQVPLSIFALGLILVLAYQAGARNSQFAPKPITAAFVDLEEVLSKLMERAAEDVRLAQMGESLKAEDESRMDELKRMENDLDDLYTVGTAAYEQARDEWIERSLEYRAWGEFSQLKLEREKGLIFKTLYDSVKVSVAEMAKQQGYYVVFLNDSIKEVAVGSEQIVAQQVSARRVLYAAELLDITEELIIKMNNDFTAGN